MAQVRGRSGRRAACFSDRRFAASRSFLESFFYWVLESASCIPVESAWLVAARVRGDGRVVGSGWVRRTRRGGGGGEKTVGESCRKSAGGIIRWRGV
ncbi:uncharacterized protein BP01DRAFT_199708 [Aspergillus saccharolyticus JOP 1030-1]|uniref:Uncharacterized protein n=1 Tax=Aspergillus saccharolyticus JOP 1030-1 TaxID=1450539 RepID=A0A318ZLV3_9EURO|nr:hypothetical protein BP01DRAFT_199708 [Aspergillus saccharolyticus JOP 1030-1]PYH47887.1 hypothetical protein BP01DRAFT_199708 [Aspergillus saccharolyticus JOP 1030-1]